MYTTTQRVYRGVGGGNEGCGSLNGQFKVNDSSFVNEFIPPNPSMLDQMTLVYQPQHMSYNTMLLTTVVTTEVHIAYTMLYPTCIAVTDFSQEAMESLRLCQLL